MNIDLAVLADAATVDVSGKVNILGVMDRIQAQEFPARHGRIAMVLRFSAEPGETGAHEVQIRLRGPKGEQVLEVGGRIQLAGDGAAAPEEAVKVPQVLNLDGIQFPEPGSYRFEVLVDGEARATVPLRLERFAQAGGQSSPASGTRPGSRFVLVSGDPAEA